MNLGDVPLPVGVLEALGKSCFFSSLCFLLCKIGGRPADIQHLAGSESSDFPAGLQIIPEHAFMFPGPPHIALPHLSSTQDVSTPGYFVVLNITTSLSSDLRQQKQTRTQHQSKVSTLELLSLVDEVPRAQTTDGHSERHVPSFAS